MTLSERMAVIAEFSKRSDDEFDDDGNDLIALERFWEAFAHAMIAVAEMNAWPSDGHAVYRHMACRLRDMHQQERWMSDLAAPARLHSHFYQGGLTATELERPEWQSPTQWGNWKR